MAAHLKDGPSRAGPWTSNDWHSMAHKPDELAVPTGRVGGPCRRAVQVGCTGVLAHIKFCFVIKPIFFTKNLYLVCNCIICGNANFLILKPRKNIFIYIFFKITKNLKY